MGILYRSFPNIAIVCKMVVDTCNVQQGEEGKQYQGCRNQQLLVFCTVRAATTVRDVLQKRQTYANDPFSHTSYDSELLYGF